MELLQSGLLCSCQFVVSASGDYDVHVQDPDKLVDWECIEQVVGQNVHDNSLPYNNGALIFSETFLSRDSILSNLSLSTHSR